MARKRRSTVKKAPQNLPQKAMEAGHDHAHFAGQHKPKEEEEEQEEEEYQENKDQEEEGYPKEDKKNHKDEEFDEPQDNRMRKEVSTEVAMCLRR